MGKKEHKCAPRYSLIIETKNNEKYYYDTNLGTFVLMEGKLEPTKAPLPVLDTFTSFFNSIAEICEKYSIRNISKIYITYQMLGEKRLRIVKNNPEWNHISYTYGGRYVNFGDKKTEEAFEKMYWEIADLESGFTSYLLKDEKKVINLPKDVIRSIENIRTHERAIRDKNKYSQSFNSSLAYNQVNDIYSEDRYGFCQDLRKKCQNYRLFRTLYLNYCQYIEKNSQPDVSKTEKPRELKKVKTIVPPHQTSIFDKDYKSE